MLVSHMESKGQRWPNVRLGELGDVSAAFNYGISDMMMNNLWVYDVNILDELNNDHISGFPAHGSSEFMVSDPGLSSRFFVDTQQNRENDDPNSMKVPYEYAANKQAEMIEPKKTQKDVKRQRSKRCRRTVFEGPWPFKSSSPTLSTDLYGSNDNRGSAMTKITSTYDVGEPISKIQKGDNLESNIRYGSIDNQGSAMSKRTLTHDVEEPISKIQKGGNLESNILYGSIDNQGSAMTKITSTYDVEEPVSKIQKGDNLESNDLYGSIDNRGPSMSKRTLTYDVEEPISNIQKGGNLESNDLYGSIDNRGSAMSKKTLTYDVEEPISNIQKGGNLESNDLYGSIDNRGSAMSKRTLTYDVEEPISKIQKGGNLESNELISESIDRCNGVGVNSVGRWLEDVGFGRYAGVFEIHEVDEEALPLLTLDDLKEIGVLAVGPRRKLYAAISKLKGASDD